MPSSDVPYQDSLPSNLGAVAPSSAGATDDSYDYDVDWDTPGAGSTSSPSPPAPPPPHRPDLPRILLMGPRRSGKTSIQRVVFGKMSPHETLFRLEPTQRVETSAVEHNPLCRFQVWDFPGDYGGESPQYGGTPPPLPDPDGATFPPSPRRGRPTRTAPDAALDARTFASARALIFVIDAQDEPYDHVLQRFTDTVARAVRHNPHISVEVFINKVDGELFLSDEAKYDCRRDVVQQVSDELAEAGLPDLPVAYYLTSIYDHSVYEAFSKCVQKLVPALPTLENLANVLVSTCSMEKAFLFDVASKLYISTDSTPVDMQSYELCSDMIDVVLDVSGIYGVKPAPQRGHEGDGGSDDGKEIKETDGEEDEVAAYDSESSSVIRLSNGMVLYLKEVGTMLALVCLTRSENFKKKSLVNYNIECFKKAIGMLLEVPDP
eukprot:CAMPEP_0194294874 /NCGR_PEP_ID=MMETSP0169-20130528/51931_1 /TAXON_ID=218684 /ORGANISM="Corethron pennatum, Strain L29A3" /LENGTH=433 /DNA_ID=CAMNT_0039043875 /DNA_START=15 /DNA_END=1319 /DNA_ORIENTATION=-